VFVRSGTVGDYLFAFWDLVHVRIDVVCRYVDSSRNVTLCKLLGRVCVDENRCLRVEVFLRIGECDARSILSFGMPVTVDCGTGFRLRRSRCRLDGDGRGGVRARSDRKRANQKQNCCLQLHKLLFTKCLEHFIGMLFDIHLVEYLRDLSFFIDQKSLPINSHVLLSVHALFDPDAVLFNYVLIGIRDKVELQAVFRSKLLM
jgi:hypothetical protein